nr:MAG: hypothetical protein [Arizlama virus]
MAFVAGIEGLTSAAELAAAGIADAIDYIPPSVRAFTGAAGTVGGLNYGAYKMLSQNVGHKRSYHDDDEPPSTPPRVQRPRVVPSRPPRPTAAARVAPVVPSREMFAWLDTTSRRKIARVRRARWKTRHFRNSSYFRRYSAARKIQRAFRRNYYRRPKSSSYVKYSKYKNPKLLSGRPYWNHNFTRQIYPRPYLDSRVGESYGKLRRLKHRAGRVHFRRWKRPQKWLY